MATDQDGDFLKHALYWNGVACTWIPKVACTSLRHSFAVAEGLVSEDCEQHEIPNAATLKVKRSDVASARYRFVVMRQPIHRLVSCFLDRVVLGELRKYHCDDASTFEDFVDWVAENGHMNHHTRAQVRFIHGRYDNIFRMEVRGWPEYVRARAGLKIIRREWPHHLSNFHRPVNDHHATKLSGLRILRSYGVVPTIESMLTAALAKRINAIYAEDVRAYESIS